jgi:hypothetical protein
MGANMTEHDNLHEDQELHEAVASRRRHLAETFPDPNLFVGLATDPPPTGQPTKSALHYERVRLDNMKARRLDQAKKTAATAAQLDSERRAYEHVMDLVQAGKPVPADELLAADRYAKREGKVPVQSSAEKMAG